MTASTLDGPRALCFEGGVPAVIATAAADGTPNVTYLSRVQLVDDERVALSNQFFSKTARNLAENPRASVLLIEPLTYEQFRLHAVLRAHRAAGPGVRAAPRADVDALAALIGMQDVFKLRAADIYRVVDIERCSPAARRAGDERRRPRAGRPGAEASPSWRAAAPVRRPRHAGRARPSTGWPSCFGYEHSLLLLLDEDGRRLYTIASRGYDAEGVGSEVVVGEGLDRHGRRAVRADADRQPAPDGEVLPSVRRAYEDSGDAGDRRGTSRCRGCRMPRAGSPCRRWRYGQLVGVLLVESDEVVAFAAADEARAQRRRHVVANAVERERARTVATEPRSAAARDAGQRRRAATGRPPGCGTSRSTAARSSTATTSSRASRPHPVVARRPARARRPRRLHQPRAAARPVARAARVPRQPREPADPPQAPARRARARRCASRRPGEAGSACT